MNKAELLKRCEELGIENVTEELTNKKLKELVDAKEAEIADTDVDASEEETPVYTDKLGRDWQFKPTSPKTINIDGRPMTQEEILDAEDVMSELVYGNCNFITQKH